MLKYAEILTWDYIHESIQMYFCISAFRIIFILLFY